MASSLPPNGLPSANAIRPPHAQATDILQNDAAKAKVPVHSFHPDASPAEKAAVAGQAATQLSGTPTASGSVNDVARELPLDTGSHGVLPTITIEDADKEQAKDAPQLPGDLPASKASQIPNWYRVGWPAFTTPEILSEDADQKQLRLMNAWLSDQYYGQWYHNAAIITFAVLASHFMTRFNFGWGWLFLLLALCSTYYTTSMARVRQRARDDIQRELIKTRLVSEHESAEWINNFMERFWRIYEPVLSATIVASVDQILSANCPPFLESLRLTDFTLGNKAPRIDKVRTFPKSAEDEIVMDWGFSFTPNDLSDLTHRQAASKTNPKIVLNIRVGKGPASASFPVLVEDTAVSGLMRIRLKLMTSFPHIQMVDASFLEKPFIDYVLKPIGGETFGFDMMNIPGLSSFIREMIHSTLGPMMYDPNVFSLNLEQLLSGTPVDAAIGVVKVTVYGARSISVNRITGGSLDPYISFSINNVKELGRTKYKNDTYNPTWNETKFILVNRLTDHLVLTLMDYNEFRRDAEIGASLFELSKLDVDATQDGQCLPILKDGKTKGELRCDVAYFPVLRPLVNGSGVQELPESNVGIVRFTIHQAKDLDFAKVRTADLNAFAKVFLGNASAPIHTTSTAKHTLQPVWESSTEFLCTDRGSSVITVNVVDGRGFAKGSILGYLTVRLRDLLEARKDVDRDWWPLIGCKSGRVRLTTEWKPLDMAGSLHGADQYVPPIGAVRLWLKKATDVKNVEATLGGKSDPYVRVMVNNTVTARTEVINNNLNPEWDQIIYTPVHSLKETLLLEVMDYQNLTKDRSLGSVELKVGELARVIDRGADDHPLLHFFESTGKKDKSEPIRLDPGNQYKGQLHYLAEFLPAFALQGLKFETDSNESQSAVAGVDGEGDDVGSDREPVMVRTPTTKEPIGTSKEQTKSQQSTEVPTSANEVSKAVGNGELSPTRETHKRQEKEGIKMSMDELLTHQSGIIIFYAKSGDLSKKGRLEILLDDGYWPAFSTTRAPSQRAEWKQVGEGFMKELDFGRVWLRLNEADEGDRDDVFGEWKGDAKPFLSRTLNTPSEFRLLGQDEKVMGTVEIETRFVPVPVELEPRETVNNQGSLRVTLQTGHDLRAVDRGGKSDPYAVFTLNGERVFKSQVKKKTVNPEWHENFTITVPSRFGSNFQVEVLDWNQLEQAKSLGIAKIDLEAIEPLTAVDTTHILSTEKHGNKGEVKVNMVFRPEIIMRSRKSTSTFSAAGRTMTAIGTAPINAGKGVIQGVASGVATGVATVFKRGKDNDEVHGPVASGAPAETNIPGMQISQPIVDGEHLEVPVVSSAASGYYVPAEPVALKVSVLDAKDLIGGPDVKPYAVVRIGEREYKTKHTGKTVAPEWNETFEFHAVSSSPKLFVSIFDHKTLGKDKSLGDAEVDIWQHIQPTSNGPVDVSAEMTNGHGIIKLRLALGATESLGRKPSVSSPDHNGASTLTSPSRFSLRNRRLGLDKEE